MGPIGYLLEKVGYVCAGLARAAAGLKELGVGTPAHQEVQAHLEVAAFHALRSISLATGIRWKPEWPKALVGECTPFWERLARTLEAGINEERADSGPALRASASRTLSALLDLIEALRERKLLDLGHGSVKASLAFALNGLTKVIATLHLSDWDDQWPEALLNRGRTGLEEVLREMEQTAKVTLSDLGEYAPLRDDLWLAGQDPDSSPEKNQEAERRRRLSLSDKSRYPGDLRIPRAYKDKPLEAVLDFGVPEHAECGRFAKAPEGRSLVLSGVFTSGLLDIQWAIGRHWFVERLHQVSAFDWHELVEDNLLAQTRTVWKAPYFLIVGLRPITLPDESTADPGYAERLLQFRLKERLSTVITIERYGPMELGLRKETLGLLEQAVNVHLPPLEDRQPREWRT